MGREKKTKSGTKPNAAERIPQSQPAAAALEIFGAPKDVFPRKPCVRAGEGVSAARDLLVLHHLPGKAALPCWYLVAAADSAAGSAVDIWASLETGGGLQLAPSLATCGIGSVVRLAETCLSDVVDPGTCSLSPALDRCLPGCRGDGPASQLATSPFWPASLGFGGSPTKQRLAETIARDQLLGARLLPANMAPLTLLGQSMAFVVAGSIPPAEVLGTPPAVWAPTVTADSKVRILDAKEALPRKAMLQMDTALSTPLPSMNMPSTPPARVEPAVPDVVEAAQQAAMDAVGGGPEGAAAVAAGRAAAAGEASRSRGLLALGGLQDQIQALRNAVLLPLQTPHLFARYGVQPPCGVLLWGPPGTGKTSLARAAAADSGAQLFVVNGPDLVSEFYGESEEGLQGIMAAAKAASPAVIFIDELDALVPARQGGDGVGGSGSDAGGDASMRLVAALLTAMDGLHGRGPEAAAAGCRVVVIAATNRPEAVDRALRRPGRFDRELEVGVPSPQDRLAILRSKLMGMAHGLSEQDVQDLAFAAHGFVGADLAALAQESALTALRRIIAARAAPVSASAAGSPGTDLQVTRDDFLAARSRIRPSALREVAVEVPNVHWGDVGGLDAIKQRLKEAVEWPQKNPEALARVGAKPPRGVLLYGPPGCSKTLLARAVACEAKLNFLSVKGPELFSKYVGESEKAVAALFARARSSQPAIIFFDEIDGLAGVREGGGSGGPGVGERVISQLLVEMDGLQARAGVVVLAATNRPDRVDAALLRPGRFDRLLHVPLPDAAGRQAILGIHTRSTPLAPDVNLSHVAAQCQGATGAELSGLVREASLAALQESFQATQVTAAHFEQALEASLRREVNPAAWAGTSLQRFDFRCHPGL
ncbi:hypothetical protein WJX84_006660 [Apatococcus fuscideae]|uniref:AAA+ ATPase domain-containing protein n=1 Tax=Apatococcus fuscideae TaxID=2026836 RepID=A0AAW1RMW4_9CHLO